MKRNIYTNNSGLTLIETLVASAVFLVVAVALYQAYTGLFRVVSASRIVLSASSLATELFEIARNMPYEDVGVSGSIPNGLLPHVQVVTRDGIAFTATTTVRNIDDPSDGTIGGTPNDLSPADSKLVQVEIGCATCRNFSPLVFTTRVGPKNLETASNNGALFIRVFDADGVPVQGASVHVVNNTAAPAIVIDDVTDADGLLQLVDVPPGIGAYEIVVTKAGYSEDRTYRTGDAANPNPTKPHATVALQQVTQISFTIDKVSELSFESVTQTCASVGGLDFVLSGSKLIGTTPDVYKYYENHVTDGAGALTVPGLEWDTYTISVTDSMYDLAGLIPLLPPTLAPDSHLAVQLVVAPADPNALLVTVKDAATQLPISDATVALDGGDSQVTGRGFLSQTDWSGGAGQTDFSDETAYYADDGRVETNNPAGVVTLNEILGTYEVTGELESSIFNTGSPSDFYQIRWQPEDQPPEAGAESVRLQVASENEVTATTTWEFLGPDDTSGTYYTLADQNISAFHADKQYFKYKLFLTTASTTLTPTVSDVSFVFTSECVPPGQVLFGNVANGVHEVTVTKTGYQTLSDPSVVVDDSFVSYEVSLIPE